MEKWVVMRKGADFQKIADKFDVHPIIARLIRNRDIIGDENIDFYLNGTIGDLHDGMLMKDMDRALDILLEKIHERRKIRVIGDYDNPYLTLKSEYETNQILVFGEMAKRNFIYKGLKPVYWCPECDTALAEAEIEYAEDPCYSIYVKFG